MWDQVDPMSGWVNQLMSLREKGAIKPKIARAFPFDQAAAARQLARSCRCRSRRGRAARVNLLRANPLSHILRRGKTEVWRAGTGVRRAFGASAPAVTFRGSKEGRDRRVGHPPSAASAIRAILDVDHVARSNRLRQPLGLT
jgi:hypothetical protein